MTALRTLVAALLLAAASPAPQASFGGDVIVVSGELVHHRATNELFHIDELWMQVTPDTVFHRWLSQGIDREVSIILTRNPERYGDFSNVRILSGRLMHITVPSVSPVMHVLYVEDQETGALSPVTFQTDDPDTARKFDEFEDRDVSLVIEIP
jgi:hypothetical protein